MLCQGFASLPGSGLVTQIWRLCLLRRKEAEPPCTAFPGGTWELATWGVKPPIDSPTGSLIPWRVIATGARFQIQNRSVSATQRDSLSQNAHDFPWIGRRHKKTPLAHLSKLEFVKPTNRVIDAIM
jgi:hypothetical protein